ncbi:hypothetical protein CANCADRAFT_148173 [Tortispora caseinolytica NRRL Y-17796]|uniref:Galactokinase n=1 Tax=Tortispora caseinolytica NRRL Y-17796 TaxID=767744 RepID=A0A1E4TH72_9ASCO|nr:hypothetical protein CANCADRAFT_148173 [Tortispora caseinolytica NRRL Y-17796]
MDELIPTRKLDEIYSASALNRIKKRYENVISSFKRQFGHEPDVVLRSPGRVNLIGDHIDYMDYSVFPMAIEPDIIMAYRTTDTDTIELFNTDPEFDAINIDLSAETLQIGPPHWSNYFIAGHIVAHQYMTSKNALKLTGLQVCVDGEVPARSGLSSSAAFVCCACLIVLTAGNVSVTKRQLTELSIQCEKHVGVNSGGMDQAASVNGLKDHALLVDFHPINVTPVKLPDCAVVIAHSLVVADKLESAPRNYNLRVAEDSIAAAALAHHLNVDVPYDNIIGCPSLRAVELAHFKTPAKSTEEQIQRLTSMEEICAKLFPQDGCTDEQAANLCGISVDQLRATFMRSKLEYTTLSLYKRSVHVYAEAKRVLQFFQELSTTARLEVLGQLMDESQESSRTMVCNSCPEVDQLCAIAKEAGSLGSRVTGAGFGGCTVHLLPNDDSLVEKLIKAFKDKYYSVYYPNIDKKTLSESIIESRPSSGTAFVAL